MRPVSLFRYEINSAICSIRKGSGLNGASHQALAGRMQGQRNTISRTISPDGVCTV